jgi:phosphoribosylformylglycinamidine cyclo-ligase
MAKPIRYKDAGVDISAGEEAVNRIKGMVRETFTPHVLTDLGKFGGFYQPDLAGYRHPVLVSSIDGVGTKLKVAVLAERHDTIGEDLVNHCVNDILVGGALPLFFMDYIGTGRLEPGVMEQIIQGIVRGCRQAGCALVGGEMAEMPGFYQAGEYDVAGCIVGIVEKEKIIDGREIEKNDILIGLSSNGLHTNGYSLARKVLLEKAGYTVDTFIRDLDASLGEELLRVHRSYLKPACDLMDRMPIRGMAHITGGGLEGNSRRILPEGRGLAIDWEAWEIPAVFQLIQKEGQVPIDDMRRTFNLGIGFIIIVEQNRADQAMELLHGWGESPVRVGIVT